MPSKTKLVCIKCREDWEGNGSPAVCPRCSTKKRKVISAAIVVKC